MILVNCFLPEPGLVAQSLTAEVSSTTVKVDVPFQYSLTIKGAASSYFKPDLKDFEILNGPNQSNTIQYVNGIRSDQLVFTYTLVAHNEGFFEIGKAAAMVDGKRVESRVVKITVVNRLKRRKHTEVRTENKNMLGNHQLISPLNKKTLR
jgi:hypothetical protein